MDISANDRDFAIRTMLGESVPEDGDAGLAGVGAVILNRLNSGNYGDSVQSVVMQPNAFEAWSARRKELRGYSKTSDTYQNAGQIFDALSSGQMSDPTNGAQFYYAPVAQAALGRGIPSFAKGQTPSAVIGHHQFYADATAPPGGFAPVTQDDITASAKALGLTAQPVQWVPIGSGHGITISVPVSTGITSDDMNDAAKALGLGSAPVSKATLPPNFTPTNLPQQATPEIQAAAAKIAPQLGFTSSMVEGMPIVGPAMNAATAATGAAIQPFVDPNAPQTFAQRFTHNIAVQEEAQRQFAAAHPIQATAGNIAGATMATVPLAETTLGAAALGLPNASVLGATIPGRVYSGAAGGATISAIDAAMRGQPIGPAAEFGGATGAVGPMIGAGAGALLRGGANWTRTPANALAGINPIGRGWLANALTNETDQSLEAALRRMGPEGFLADVNTPLTELAAGIANKPEPPGSAAIGEAYRTRDAAQRSLIEGALITGFGPRVDVEAFGNAIAENRSAAADPLYAQWRSMQVPPTPALKALIPRLEDVGAFDEARYLGAAKGIPITEKFFTSGQNKEYPTTATWDLVKRGIDSKVEQALSSGNKTRASALLGLKNELITEIGKTEAGQVWNQARREFADRSALLDQIAAGKDTFLGSRSGLSVDEMREELRGLNGPELAARVVGARNAADEVMGATRNGDTTLRSKFLAPNNQEKLRLLLGDDRASALIRTMEQQEYLAGQAKYVNPRAGSPTAPRTAAINALEPQPVNLGVNIDLTKPTSIIPEAFHPGAVLSGGRGQAYAQARQQIVPALLAKGPQLPDLISAIRQESIARAIAARRGSTLSKLLTATATGPGSQTARLRARIGDNPFIQSAQ